MLRNFLLVATRNLRKNSLYSTINIAGLSIGIACAALIMLWVSDEISFDKFLPKYDRLYQVWVSAEFDNKINNWRSVPLPSYEAMKTANSHIKNSCVADWGGDHLLTVGENRIMKRGFYVSEEFLEMFEFPLLNGSAEQALDDPMSIVISESLAKILFGDQDPIGEMVKLNDEGTLQVTGVLKDLPENSSFQFDFLATWEYRESVNEWVKENRANWGNYSFQVFVELNESENEVPVESSIANMLTENGEDDMPRTFFLYPMERWRLYSNFDDSGIERGGRSDYVNLFTVIALFILLIACINFMNLSTARSEKRAREVGIRKSLGSKKRTLIMQFISESIVIAAIAFIIAIIITQVSLPFYNELVDKKLVIDYSSPLFWIISIGGIFITGLVSGSYPAFYLSSFKPIKTLKGTIKVGKSATTPRKVLVVLQFGFAILLIISTIIIFQQIELVKNRDLGYNQENLISVSMTNDLADNYDILKQELEQSGLVVSITRSNSPITEIHSNNFLGWPGKPETQKVIFTTITTTYDYAKTMGVEMLQGRDFSKQFASDSNAIIINQSALELMNLENPIGTNLDLWDQKRKLIGVIDNVLMGSIYEPVKPMFMILQDWGGVISVRIRKTRDLQADLKAIEKIFEKHNPAYPFEYEFADMEFQKKFKEITLTRKLASIFSVLALLITGLGLFGLASYTAEQRIKEIGIRKVLGASVPNLMLLIAKDFTRLVIVAFIFTAPLTWYLLNEYLDRYTIRTNLNWWVFPAVGLIVMSFALLIVSNQARKAALTDPVNSLKDE